MEMRPLFADSHEEFEESDVGEMVESAPVENNNDNRSNLQQNDEPDTNSTTNAATPSLNPEQLAMIQSLGSSNNNNSTNNGPIVTDIPRNMSPEEQVALAHQFARLFGRTSDSNNAANNATLPQSNN